jgi:hypothetical protein
MVISGSVNIQGNAPKALNLFSRPFPYWLRLVRQGNLFIGYYSVNGSSYSIVNVQSIPMGSCLEVGMAAFSSFPGQTTMAPFSNLSVSGGGTPAIAIAPASAAASAQAGRIASLRLWPNPAREAINLELPEATFESHLRLLNQLGQPLEERRMLPGESRLVWPVGHLPAGAYFIETIAEDGQGRQVLRWVKTE